MTENTSTKRQKQNDPPAFYIFPPMPKFHVGQSVLVRTTATTKGTTAAIVGGERYERGSILAIDDGSSNVHVRIMEGDEQRPDTNTITTKLGKKDQRRRLLPDLSKNQTILLTSETNHFRQLVGHVISSDRVLEIGCSSGETSKLLIQNCQSWVGFDTSDEMLDICKSMIASVTASASTVTQQCHPVILNALIDPQNARREACRFGRDPNVIFLDIGGNRERINVLRMFSWAMDEFDPRLMVIKSRELVESIKSSSYKIDDTTGLIENGQEWFQSNCQKPVLPKHPLKAALVMSPIEPNKPICRYHNYHKGGCRKNDCPFDHDHCHACLRPGHVAKKCHMLSSSET